ncbi:DUF3078 domain-containing protein [Puteibacter caeruleilacunae]|nr:DUF3078 domain-containing protein [Puteibacter caeruleilacunae]
MINLYFMEKVRIIMLLCVVVVSATAQERDTTKLWTVSGTNTLTFSQTSLSNWSAGGENSASINLLGTYNFNYKKNKTTWDNTLILGYGLTKQGGDKARKSDDRIDLASKLGIAASEKWSYSALFGFKTQFDKGYENADDDVAISNIFAPAYFSFGLGMDYRPCEYFSLFLSPATGRLIAVADDRLSDLGAFGVDPGEKSKGEFGGALKAEFKKDLFTNVNVATKLELFSNYVEDPDHVDVLWDLIVTMKVNKFLSANFTANMLYDNDTKKSVTEGPAVQFKEIFGVGLTHSF